MSNHRISFVLLCLLTVVSSPLLQCEVGGAVCDSSGGPDHHQGPLGSAGGPQTVYGEWVRGWEGRGERDLLGDLRLSMVRVGGWEGGGGGGGGRGICWGTSGCLW